MFEIKDLTVIFDMDKIEKVFAVKNVSLKFPKTGLIGIIGPSGSGKSTLMYCMSTLKNYTSGEIIYNKKSYNDLPTKEREKLRRTEFGFVFQRHYLISYMSALNNVIVAANQSKNQSIERGKQLLTDFGLKTIDINKQPSKLSGGQRQRVAIARAMQNSPKVLFADEPTASLDHESAYMIMDILKEYSKEHLVIVITHDQTILKDAVEIIEMWDGEITQSGRD